MSCTKPELEAARKAVAVLGGPSSAAKLLNVKGHRYQTVQSWLRSRVPSDYCPSIEAQTRARGAVVWCEDMRPDVPWGGIRGFKRPEGGEGDAHAANVDQAAAEAKAGQKVEEKF